MSTEIRYNSRSLRLLYYRYKDTQYFAVGILVAIILVSIMLVLWVVLPQVNEWFSIRAETAATQERIKNIRSNIQYTMNYNQVILDDQVALATTALPPEKEFINILSAITAAAGNAQVSLQDYDFTVGELSKKAVSESLYPTQVELKVEADAVGVGRFVKEIEQKIPLSQVKSVDIAEDSAIVTVLFAYKQFPEVPFTDSVPLQFITDEQQNLLNTLKTWKAPQLPLLDQQVQQASPSASPAP